MRSRLSHGVTWLAAIALIALLILGDLGTVDARDSRSQMLSVEGVTVSQEQDSADYAEANLPYMFAVFVITWAGFFGYIFYMSRRLRDTRRDLEMLKSSLNEKKR